MPVVFALALLLGIIVFSFHYSALNQARQVHRSLWSEIAFTLAESGLTQTIAHLKNTAQVPEVWKELAEGTAGSVNGMQVSIDFEPSSPVGRLIEDYGGNQEASVDVTVDFVSFKSFFESPVSPNGVTYENEPGQEKYGKIRITSTGTYRGVTKTIVAYKKVKVVNVLPPGPLGKFTLFVKDRANQAINIIPSDKQGRPLMGSGVSPVILFNNSDGSDSDSIDDRGWIFLGGNVWRINLAYGENNYGEDFHLLKNPWAIINDPLQPAQIAAGYSMIAILRGFFTGIKNDCNLLDNYDFSSPPHDPVSEMTSVLRLYGDSRNISETLVLGYVIRRYLRLKYIQESSGQYTYLPYIVPTLAAWQSFDDVGQLGMEIKLSAFGNNPDLYFYHMSKVVSEPYNRSFDFIRAEPRELDPPLKLPGTNLIRNLAAGQNFPYLPNIGGNIDYFSIQRNDGREIFRGHLSRITTSDLGLTKKFVYVMSPSQLFHFFLKNNRELYVPGIIGIDGNLALPSIRVMEGGIIMASGDITINGAIELASCATAPLTLVSCGDMVINTPEPVEAFLIALDGTLSRGGASDLSIRGPVACGTLDLASFANGSGQKKISWNPGWDPTKKENFQKSYRVYLDDTMKWYMQQE